MRMQITRKSLHSRGCVSSTYAYLLGRRSRRAHLVARIDGVRTTTRAKRFCESFVFPIIVRIQRDMAQLRGGTGQKMLRPKR